MKKLEHLDVLQNIYTFNYPHNTLLVKRIVFYCKLVHVCTTIIIHNTKICHFMRIQNYIFVNSTSKWAKRQNGCLRSGGSICCRVSTNYTDVSFVLTEFIFWWFAVQLYDKYSCCLKTLNLYKCHVIYAWSKMRHETENS